MVQVVALDPAVHSNIRVRRVAEFAPEVSTQQILPLTVHEIPHAGNDSPVVFVKNGETGLFQTVQLLGLSAGENLMLKDGKWQGIFVPGVLRSAPFRLLMPSPGAERITVALDMDSPLISESEGEALFDGDKATAYLEQRTGELEAYFKQGQVTNAFTALLVEHDLLISQELNIDLDGRKSKVEGIYLVDENKLRELDEKVVLELNKRGFLQAIHAHLMSLRQAGRLARLK